MALDIVSIPATSANVERLFSSSRRVDDYCRQRLLLSTKREIVLCKSWWRLAINTLRLFFVNINLLGYL